MRLKVKIKAPQLSLPLNYQQIIQGFIYSTLKDRDFAYFLHSQGYPKGKRVYKLFTFSNLFGEYRIHQKSKKIIFKDEIEWQISSIVPEFIQDFGQSLLTTPDLQLLGQRINIEELYYTQPKVSDSCKITMLSPITIYSTYEKEDGKKITQYFSPDDAVFSHLIEKNLKKKYEAYYGKRVSEGEGFEIHPVRVNRRNKVITRFKGFIINAWGGVYEIRGSPEMIQFAQGVGIGGRNSQGFGMFEIV